MDVSIGIPSYNEEKSITNILVALELQMNHYISKGYECYIREVIISDDSNDSTVRLVEDYSSKSSLNIKLLHHDERRGAASAWNEIFAHAKGDLIVLYDADVIPAIDTTFILADTLQEYGSNYAICAANILPIKDDNYSIAGRASIFNASWLRRVRLMGINQYTLMGRALSIRSSIAKSISIPNLIAIDLYLQCKVMEMGYKVAYRDDAIVYFKPVNSIKEFIMQVSRALQGHKELTHDIDMLGLRLSKKDMLHAFLLECKSDPVGLLCLTISYLLYPLYNSKDNSARWSIAESSKGLSINDVLKRLDEQNYNR